VTTTGNGADEAAQKAPYKQVQNPVTYVRLAPFRFSQAPVFFTPVAKNFAKLLIFVNIRDWNNFIFLCLCNYIGVLTFKNVFFYTFFLVTLST